MGPGKGKRLLLVAPVPIEAQRAGQVGAVNEEVWDRVIDGECNQILLGFEVVQTVGIGLRYWRRDIDR